MDQSKCDVEAKKSSAQVWQWPGRWRGSVARGVKKVHRQPACPTDTQGPEACGEFKTSITLENQPKANLMTSARVFVWTTRWDVRSWCSCEQHILTLKALRHLHWAVGLALMLQRVAAVSREVCRFMWKSSWNNQWAGLQQQTTCGPPSSAWARWTGLRSRPAGPAHRTQTLLCFERQRLMPGGPLLPRAGFQRTLISCQVVSGFSGTCCFQGHNTLITSTFNAFDHSFSFRFWFYWSFERKNWISVEKTQKWINAHQLWGVRRQPGLQHKPV